MDIDHHTFELAKMGLLLAFILGIIALASFRRRHRDRQMHETLRLALEKGQPLPPDLGRWSCNRPWRRGPICELRRGLVWLGVGLGLYYSAPDHHEPWGLILIFIGVAHLVCALFGFLRPQKPTDPNDPAARP